MDGTFINEKLECGARLIAEKLPNFHSVTAGIWVGAGSVTAVSYTHLDVYKRQGVGAITETDVMLASAANAIIIGFNVRPDNMAQAAAEREKVDIRLYRIIYKAIEDITAAMKGMLEPEFEELVIGHAEVRQTFKVSAVGTIAGCYVTDGMIRRNAQARLLRDNVVIYEGALSSLKRFKDDAKEVAQGYECGLSLERFDDIKEGDVVECFEMHEIARCV